ncbi:MAG: DnaJ domain-containing protein [Bacteroidetes bacterium]|nr:DnaJ domain-containing protein [Bacteroidota bacterium]
MASLYDQLEISRNATTEEIKRAFRKQAKYYHPSVNTDRDAKYYFKQAYLAHEILTDPVKRAKYDRLHNFGTSSEMQPVDDYGDVEYDQKLEDEVEDFSKMTYKDFRNKKIVLHMFFENPFFDKLFVAFAFIAFVLSVFHSIWVIMAYGESTLPQDERAMILWPLFIHVILLPIFGYLGISGIIVQYNNYKIRVEEERDLFFR